MDRLERATNQRQRVERARAAVAGNGPLFTPLRPGMRSPAPVSPATEGDFDDVGSANPAQAVTPGARWDGTQWYVGRTKAKSGLGTHANAAYRV